MLQKTKKFASSLGAKIFLGLLALTFVSWGVGDVFRNFSIQDVAKVGDYNISEPYFRQLYNQELQSLSTRVGHAVLPEEALASGVPQGVLDRLIDQLTLDSIASELNLNISPDNLKRLAAADFSKSLDSEKLRLMRQQILSITDGSSNLPDTVAQAIFRFQTETRKLSYFRVPNRLVSELPNPTDDEVFAYYEENKEKYREPERRSLNAILIVPETVPTQEFSEDEIAATFEEMKDQFSQQEERHVLQLTFSEPAKAMEVYKRLKGGEDFMEVATELGQEKVYDLGFRKKNQYQLDAIRVAAQQLKVGEISEPVATPVSTAILKVVEIREANIAKLSDHREAVLNELSARTATQKIFDYYNTIEDDRAAGASLSEVAQKHSLVLITVDGMDQDGNDRSGQEVTLVNREASLVGNVFNTPVGVETDPLTVGAEGYIWYEVTAIEDSHDPEFETIKERVSEDIVDQMRAVELVKVAEGYLSELQSSRKSMIDLSSELGTALLRSDIFMYSRQDTVPLEVYVQAFRQPVGSYGVVTLSEDVAVMLFWVEAASTQELTPQARESNRNLAYSKAYLQFDLQSALTKGFQTIVPVKVNDAELNRAIGLDQ